MERASFYEKKGYDTNNYIWYFFQKFLHSAPTCSLQIHSSRNLSIRDSVTATVVPLSSSLS